MIKKIIIEIAIILSIELFLNLIRLWIDNIAWVRIIRLRGKLIIKLNEKILGLDYQTLERPETQDLIEKAKNALGSNWEGNEGMYNYMKNLLINLTSSLIACSIIFTAHFSLIIIIITMVIVKYILKNSVYTKDKKEFWDKLAPFKRKLNYVNNISNNFSIFKDLRIYNMSAFIEKEESITQEDVHQLLRKSEKRRFKLDSLLIIISVIQELPLEEHTFINKWFTKDGVEFSGGEMQKLAISRALYKDGPIVILNQPTAALNPLAEAEIYYRFNEVIGKKLTIFISHRLSSCRFSDRIVVLDGQNIVEIGTYEELMSHSNGRYKEMFDAQAKYYQENS